MAYHNLPYTNSMSQRAQVIGGTMMNTTNGELITERDLQLIDIATSWHDVVQDNEPVEEQELFMWEGKEYLFTKKREKETMEVTRLKVRESYVSLLAKFRLSRVNIFLIMTGQSWTLPLWQQCHFLIQTSVQ